MQSKLYFKNLFILSSIFYLLLIVTNQYHSLDVSTAMGFTDQSVYLEIINAAPYLPMDDISSQQASRFFIPYMIGIIFEYMQIKNHLYLVLICMNILFDLMIIKLFLEITLHYNVKRNINLVLVSALIFNAYNFRANLYAPLMLNDIIFTYGLLLVVSFFVKKKVNHFYIGLILCCLTRQTSMILNVIFFIMIFNKIFFKSNFKQNIFINGIIINVLIFLVLKDISSSFSVSSMTWTLLSSISVLFTFEYTFLDLLYVMVKMIVANFILIILTIVFILKYHFYKKRINFDLIIILIIGLSIWIQPILGSPSYTGNNISRLTIISLPVFLIFFSIIFKDLQIKLLNTGIIIILIFLSGMHHNYTYFFNLFFEFKNYHFAIVSFFSHTLIVILFLKRYGKYIQKK
jgi:hypothetical protein